MNEFEMQRRLQDAQIAASRELSEQEGADKLKAYAPQMVEEVSQAQAQIIAQTDPEIEAFKVIQKFRGFSFRNGEWVRVRKPLMTEEGLDYFEQLLGTLACQSARLARLEKSDARRYSLELANVVTDYLGVNHYKIGIPDLAVCDTIRIELAIFFRNLLSRSEDQNEKNWLGKVTIESIGTAKKGKQGGGGSTWDEVKDKLRL